MQICEACSDYETCKLPKRERNDYLAPCDFYRAAQNAFAVDEVKAMIRRAAQPAHIYEIVNVTVPIEITPKGILGGVERDLYIDFLNTNFADIEQARAFFEKAGIFPMARSQSPISRNPFDAPPAGFVGSDQPPGQELLRELLGRTRPDIKAVQEDLRAMFDRWQAAPEHFGVEKVPLRPLGAGADDKYEDVVDEVYSEALKGLLLEKEPAGQALSGYDTYIISGQGAAGVDLEAISKPTDIFRLDAWFRRTFRLSIERTKEGGLKSAGRVWMKYWYGILYFLFSLDVIEKQGVKKCLVGSKGCKGIYRPGKRGKKSKTCSNPACQMAMKRYPERYLK